jgi:excisionase family DNA binding protein
MHRYLTTKEVADLLRLKERKVYDLAATGGIPCTRATGKLLFPRDGVDAWLSNNTDAGALVGMQRPNVFLGSHDPLLDWALLESRCGIATFFDGSTDGFERFCTHQGIAAGLHLFDPATGEWNAPLIRGRLGLASCVLVEWGWRRRGLIIAPEQAASIRAIGDLKGRRVVPRQPEAGSQVLLKHVMSENGLAEGDLEFTATARSETDAAVAVLEGKADAAFGLEALAAKYRLHFVPVVNERYDLLVDRRAWFEPPMQKFLDFCRSKVFAEKVGDYAGYDVSGLGRVHFNGLSA